VSNSANGIDLILSLVSEIWGRSFRPATHLILAVPPALHELPRLEPHRPFLLSPFVVIEISNHGCQDVGTANGSWQEQRLECFPMKALCRRPWGVIGEQSVTMAQ